MVLLVLALSLWRLMTSVIQKNIFKFQNMIDYIVYVIVVLNEFKNNLLIYSNIIIKNKQIYIFILIFPD